MRIAVYPGSFDPVTFGHVDILTRAAKLFDKVIVLVSVNPRKKSSFTAEEREDMLKRVTSGLGNIVIDSNSGLLVDYMQKIGADIIVKGLRAMSDFESEFQMALANKKLLSGAETIFLPTSLENMFLSSSVVKQIAMFGGDITPFVPKEILEDITKRLRYQ